MTSTPTPKELQNVGSVLEWKVPSDGHRGQPWPRSALAEVVTSTRVAAWKQHWAWTLRYVRDVPSSLFKAQAVAFRSQVVLRDVLFLAGCANPDLDARWRALTTVSAGLDSWRGLGVPDDVVELLLEQLALKSEPISGSDYWEDPFVPLNVSSAEALGELADALRASETLDRVVAALQTRFIDLYTTVSGSAVKGAGAIARALLANPPVDCERLDGVVLPIVRQLRDRDPGCSYDAAQVLVMVGEAAARTPYQERLIARVIAAVWREETLSPALDVVAQLVEAIPSSQVSDLALALANKLEHLASVGHCRSAALAVGELGSRLPEGDSLAYIVSALLGLLGRPSWDMGKIVTEALEALGPALVGSADLSRVVSQIAAAVHHPELPVRVNALRALGGLCRPLANSSLLAVVVALLLEQLRSPIEDVQAAAAKALSGLVRPLAGGTLASTVVAALLDALQKGALEYHGQVAALEALGQIGATLTWSADLVAIASTLIERPRETRGTNTFLYDLYKARNESLGRVAPILAGRAQLNHAIDALLAELRRGYPYSSGACEGLAALSLELPDGDRLRTVVSALITERLFPAPSLSTLAPTLTRQLDSAKAVVLAALAHRDETGALSREARKVLEALNGAGIRFRQSESDSNDLSEVFLVGRGPSGRLHSGASPEP